MDLPPLVNEMATGIVLLDHQGRLIFANDWFLNTTGIGCKEAENHTLEKLFPELKKSRILTAISEAVDGHRATILSSKLSGTLFPFKTPGHRNMVQRIFVKPYDLKEGNTGCFIQISDETVKAEQEELLKEKTRSIEMLHNVATTANTAESTEEAMQAALRYVCNLMKWPVGHIYERSDDDPDLLVPTKIWHLADPKKFATFRKVTEKTSLKRGHGLPGRVFESQQHIWIADVTKDANFPRAKQAKNIGVKAGLALPIMVEGEVGAVLEFFTPKAVEPDETLLKTLDQVGLQIGRMIERERATAIIRAAEEQNRLLLAAAEEGIYGLDLEGRTIFANPAACEMLGYSEEELIGQPMHTLVNYTSPDGRPYPREECAMFTPVAGEVGAREDKVLWRRDGASFPIEYTSTSVRKDGELSGVVVTFHDITERKNAEAEITSLARFPQESPNPILRVDKDGKIIYANGAAGIFATEKAREDSRCDPGGWNKLLVLTRDRKAATNVEVACGSRVFSFVVSPSETSDDINLYGLDVTQRKQAEIKLKALKIEAENANHAKSQFLSSMSHELRTPLNSILGFSQILVTDREAPLNQDQSESVDQIMASGKHLLDLINDVLDLSRIESKKIELSIEDVDISQLVDETAGLIQAQAENSGIAVHRETTGQAIPFLKADYTKLKQVLLNLLSNAIKYNHEGGQVTLVPERREDGKIRINVSDTGDGIAQDQLPGLFEPFNRLGRESSAIEGTGIGLTITKRLVEAMKGEIGVDSVPGEGSNFWVEFDEGEALEQELDAVLDQIECTPADVTAQEKRIKVLYVEDNPANMRFVRKVISRLPQFDLLEATTAEDGLEAAFSQNPDIILMDINLPGTDGFQVLEVLQEQDLTDHMQVIALSANAMKADIKKGLDAGFDDYLTKPVNVDKLVEVLEKAAAI